MKKFLFVCALAAFSLSFIACGNKSAKDTPADGATPKTEEAAPSKGGDVLAQYETIINKIIKLYEDGKIQSGDATALQEYTKLSEEMNGISEELQAQMQSLTPAQTQKFAELGQKLADAAMKGANK